MPVLADKFYIILFGPAIIGLFYIAKIISKAYRCRRLNDYFSSQYDAMLWNGVIGFLYANYMCISIAVFIQFADQRLGPEHAWQEKMNVYFNYFFAVLLALIPLAIAALYYWKLESVFPLPDLK